MNRMKYILVCVGIFCSLAVFGQTAITVAESTLKVNGLGEEVFYYGFAKGDEVIFNFEVLDGKALKEIEITELPSLSDKFMDYKSTKIENKILTVTETGIYKFRFSNSAISKRVCRFKIQRIPANESLAGFNTNVYWGTKDDTLYTSVPERYLIRKDSSFQNFYSSTVSVKAGKSQVIEFNVPENTVSWAFYIGTNEEGQNELKRAQSSFLKSSAAILVNIPGYGPMAALALTGISYFNNIQDGSNVKYWFLTDATSVTLYKTGSKLMHYYKQGDVINEASQMRFPLKGKIYLALFNDNYIDPIKVTINTTAVVVKDVWGVRSIEKRNIISAKKPYLKD